jgi:hypothetical protein
MKGSTMKGPYFNKRALAALAVLALGLIGFAPVANADWNPGDPYKMHYPQLPNLSPSGLDVLATYGGVYFNPASGSYVPLANKILADDFRCTQSGPITDIHIWGSWLNDIDDPAAKFHLSIHADIPASTGGLPYSTPGATLWQMDLTPRQMRIYANAPEHFYDPNTHTILGPDNQVWQYNFFIDPAVAFQQQEGTIYWLDVQYLPATTQTTTLFGWKTSLDHFNDDAVFGDNFDPSGEPQFWSELIDPNTGQSLDMAFVITGIPEPSMFALIGLGVGALVIFRRR